VWCLCLCETTAADWLILCMQLASIMRVEQTPTITHEALPLSYLLQTTNINKYYPQGSAGPRRLDRRFADKVITPFLGSRLYWESMIFKADRYPRARGCRDLWFCHGVLSKNLCQAPVARALIITRPKLSAQLCLGMYCLIH